MMMQSQQKAAITPVQPAHPADELPSDDEDAENMEICVDRLDGM